MEIKKQKVYAVELFRYPVELTISATSKNEAIEKAKTQIDFSVWESKATIIQN